MQAEKNILTEEPNLVSEREETLRRGLPIDIVVITFNRLLYLQECVSSLATNTRYPHRVIVVDDGSEDGSREWLRENQDRFSLKLLFNKQNLGSARARMRGLHLARSGIVGISDDDAFYRPGWLEECVRVFKAYPDAGIVSVHNPGEAHNRNVLGEDTKDGILVRFRTAISPMHWVFDKKVVMDAGGFTLPDGRVMGYAGTPLCSKIRAAGYKVVRSTRMGLDENGKPSHLVVPMDTTWSPKNHRAFYDKTGYSSWRRLAKKGRTDRFVPRKVK